LTSPARRLISGSFCYIQVYFRQLHSTANLLDIVHWRIRLYCPKLDKQNTLTLITSLHHAITPLRERSWSRLPLLLSQHLRFSSTLAIFTQTSREYTCSQRNFVHASTTHHQYPQIRYAENHKSSIIKSHHHTNIHTSGFVPSQTLHHATFRKESQRLP
jgi:hypothetical protein